MKKDASKKSMPKAQMGSIVKAAKVAKVTSEVADAAKLAKRAEAAKKAQQAKNVSKELSVYQKERMAQGKPVYRGSNPAGNMTMKEIQAKQALQKKPKKLTKEQQYQKDIEDSYRQTGGATGRSISKKAADRKVSKGKGTIAYNWGPGASEAGSESNKGDYIGYGKNAKTTVSGWKSLSDSKKPRPIRKTGGMIKKQEGGYTPSNQPGGRPTAGGAILENRINTPKMPKMGEMTPKEKRQQKREMKSTLKYVKKHGSGLAMKKGGSTKK